jgi:hypothetical protein
MSNRRVLQAPVRRPRPTQQRQWSIWDYIFGGYYNG